MFLKFLFFLFLQFSWLILTSSASTPLPQAKPGCTAECGDLTIPYPFGIGPNENGCSLTGVEALPYNITCDTTYDPPKPFIGIGRNNTAGLDLRVEVISISKAEFRVKNSPATRCYEYESGELTLDEGARVMNFNATPFTVSYTKNRFFGLGCDTLALIYEPILNFTTDCSTICKTSANIIDGSCSGSGCCQTKLPKGVKVFAGVVISRNTSSESFSFDPCSYSFIGESENYTFSASDLKGGSFYDKAKDVPVVLDWAIGTKTCEEAQQDMSSYACQKNSTCSNSGKVPGYLCTCIEGFEGNPYLSPGCHDVNECEDQSNKRCEGICTNTIGSYDCSCPKGSHGDGKISGTGCIRDRKEFPIIIVAVGVGLGFLFMILAGSFLYLRIRKRQFKSLNDKFFNQNGGLLLKQHISSYEGVVGATKIFSAEELEAATNNYSDELILGRGGFGTVYLGTLSDKRKVAIKKSKVIDKSQIEQFINELVILAQVNHRNVVKVLGCCLETEVPLLVYEYISNGTLFQHIHKKVEGMSSSFYVDGMSSQFSLSWRNRLKIATESAGALAYLHSSTSIPIIHRDIKSANILLDDNYTAKVSDFGASRLNTLGETQIDTLVQGTLGYLDPEYYQTSLLTDKSDVYSFGVVLVELLTGEKPISLNRPQAQRSLASFFLYAMERNDVFTLIQPRVANEGNHGPIIAVAELAKRCLNMKGGERPTMKEVAAELESLSKLESYPSGVHNQPIYEEEPNVIISEPIDLYSAPINSNISGDSGLYSTDQDMFTSTTILR
ncbi:hypothetical protein C5167_037344 [Papaver somniferum]|uniref:Protein kinase domain-containing protein n=1 Tax=Papaver somniferum TaxID=3469 RepID=A0A4Y7I8M4_PAPSO|nr:hypothetical protein C5167_037344 [Papaver somniferum]